MKKRTMYFLAASLLMAAPVFTSCSDDDDPVPEKPVDPKPEEPEEPETPVVKNPIESAITYKTAEGVPQLVLTMGDDQTPVLGKAVVFTPDATEPTKKATLTFKGDQLNLIEMIMSGMSSRASDMTLEELLGQLSALQLPGLVAGVPSTEVPVEISEIKDETVFFSGKYDYDQTGCSVSVSGTAKTGQLVLNVKTELTNELAGTTWSTKTVTETDPLAPFHIVWKQNLPEGVQLLPMEVLIQTVLGMVPVGETTLGAALNAALQSVTFRTDGNIQASYMDMDNVAAGYQTSPLHVAQFNVNPTTHQLLLQLNIPQIIYVEAQKKAAQREAESGSALQELLPELLEVLPGLAQSLIPMVSSCIPLTYELNGDQLCLYLGKEVLKPMLEALSPLTQSEKVQQVLTAFIEAKLIEAGQGEDAAKEAAEKVKAFLTIYPQIMESTEDIQLGIEMTKQ